jgi:hypothetical protein
MRKLSVLLILAMAISIANAQDSQSLRYWSTVGSGFTLREFVFGSSFGAGVTFNPNDFIFSARYIRISTLKQSEMDYPFDWLGEFSILTGLSFDKGNMFYGISVGPGLVKGHFNDLRSNKAFTSVSFSLEAFSLYKISSSFGMGLSAFANLNKEQPYFGAWLSVHVGSFGK